MNPTDFGDLPTFLLTLSLGQNLNLFSASVDDQLLSKLTFPSAVSSFLPLSIFILQSVVKTVQGALSVGCVVLGAGMKDMKYDPDGISVWAID